MIEIFSPNSLLGPHKSLTIAGLHSGEWAVILELDQRELRLSGLLIDEVVIVLKIQIIRIPLIRPEADKHKPWVGCRNCLPS